MIVLNDLYTMSPQGRLYFQNGWNRRALVALAIAGIVSIGLALLGAYGLIPALGDWGWLIGAALGGTLHVALMSRAPATGPVQKEIPA